MMRQHRNELAYPAMWRAVAGAVRDAAKAHPEIQIPERRVASIVKRVVGQVLALQGVGAGEPAETVLEAVRNSSASGVSSGASRGRSSGSRPQNAGVGA